MQRFFVAVALAVGLCAFGCDSATDGATFFQATLAGSNETPEDTASETVEIVYNPAMIIEKVDYPEDQLADEACEALTYLIGVKNTGNVTLTGVTVTDPNADVGVFYLGGDADGDSKLDVGETWLYSAGHTLTQAEIDPNGGGDGDIDNLATADSNETAPVSDEAVRMAFDGGSFVHDAGRFHVRPVAPSPLPAGGGVICGGPPIPSMGEWPGGIAGSPSRLETGGGIGALSALAAGAGVHLPSSRRPSR